MGNFLKIFSDCVSVIASARLWLEDAAVQQLLTTAQLPGMQQVVGLLPAAGDADSLRRRRRCGRCRATFEISYCSRPAIAVQSSAASYISAGIASRPAIRN